MLDVLCVGNQERRATLTIKLPCGMAGVGTANPTARISMRMLPDEIRPPVSAVNGVLERLTEVPPVRQESSIFDGHPRTVSSCDPNSCVDASDAPAAQEPARLGHGKLLKKHIRLTDRMFGDRRKRGWPKEQCL